MLNKIQVVRKTQADQQDAIALLLGCHERIRHFTQVALKIAESPDSPDRTDAARAVLRYFQIALPLHEADENDSVYPRLRERLPAGTFAEANTAMVRQHTEIDGVVGELIPEWQSIAEQTKRDAGSALYETTERLQGLWDEHLALEEQKIFPAMRKYLTGDDLESIRSEMRGRRES